MYDSILSEAEKLYKLGFAIHWCLPREKRPVASKWTTGPRTSWQDLKRTYKPGYNVGVRTGSPSKLGEGRYLACIDVDIKKPEARKAAVQALKKLLRGAICPEVRSGSGNGSRHLYCVTKEPFQMITVEKHKDEWEICVYSDGRQMVLPPSIHPNGSEYVWRSQIESSRSLPLLSFEKFSESSVPPAQKQLVTGTLDDFKYSPVEIDWLPISDGMRLAIKRGVGVSDRSAHLLPAAVALHSVGCSKNEILTVLTDPDTFLGKCAYDHAQTRSRERAAKWLWNYTVRRVFEERNARAAFRGLPVNDGTVLQNVEKISKQIRRIEEETDWKDELKKTDKGAVRDTLNNLDLILSHGISQPLFLKDEFANRESYGLDAPWGGRKGTDLADIDTVLIKSWLAKSEWGLEPKNQTIEQAMALLAHRHRTHPVRDYLRSLKWDGTPRVGTWIKSYLHGEAQEPYLTEISKKFLVAMIARVFRPGCQWDYTLILEGEQGTRKSTTARTLAGDKWFCDHLPDLKDKDAMLNLQGSWLVELGELKNVKHTDAGTVKSFLTRRTDRVRAPYGKRWIDSPRQSAFIGTVNENEYFKDPTGNRRFWPVKVGRCDVDALSRDRDQLFAEAKHIFDQGTEKLYLEGAALKQALEAQDDRRVDDDITEMESELASFVERENEKKDGFDFSRFVMRDLFVNEGPWGRWNNRPYANQNGSQTLRNLGFERRKVEGQRIWGQKMRGIAKKGSAPGMPLCPAIPDFY